jgi:hypothetical protein
MKIRRIAALAILAVACRGPRPALVTSTLKEDAGRTVAEVVVANQGGGEGQIEVEVVARAPSGEVVRGEAQATLRARETILVRVPLEGEVDRGQAPEVHLHYPVE